MYVRVVFLTRDPAAVRRLCDRFGMPGPTVNREGRADVPDEDLAALRRFEEQGLLRIRELRR